MIPLGVWISLAAIAYSLGIWFLVLWIFPISSGWRKLAKQFNAPPLAPVDTRRLGSAFIGAVRYNGALKTAIDSRGLFLIPYRIFRPFHPPLLIPWSEMRIGEAAGRMVTDSVLQFPAVPGVRIALPRGILDLLRSRIGKRGIFAL